MQLFRAIRLILTLRCHESTELVSASLERQLSFSERWAVRLHVLACWSCRRFRRQIEFLRAAMRSEQWEANVADCEELDADAKARIRDHLRRNGLDWK